MKSKQIVIQFFREQLLRWHHQENNRIHPWTGKKDPYKIWLSEIILQQTRIEQGFPYYQRFIKAYPTIRDLAGADDEAVFKLWQGLGYYNRCRNMLATAREITNRMNGKFPQTFEEIKALKGIGDYTAAAIASFAFDLPHAVLDGNVYRVLSRFLGIDTPIDTGAGKKIFTETAGTFLDQKQPADYNQAIMDFGATICRPKNPQCEICPLATHCIAYQQGLTQLLPVKEKKIKIKERNFTYLVLKYKDLFFTRQRGSQDIWGSLFDFYLLKDEESPEQNKINRYFQKQPELFFSTTQRLTHQLIKSQFYLTEMRAIPEQLNSEDWLPLKDLYNLPVSKTMATGISALAALLNS